MTPPTFIILTQTGEPGLKIRIRPDTITEIIEGIGETIVRTETQGQYIVAEPAADVQEAITQERAIAEYNEERRQSNAARLVPHEGTVE